MSSNSIATIGGIGLAATGVAHFIVPSAFHGITAPAFPDDVETAIKINGSAETLIGVAIAVPRTRKAGLVGLGLYVSYLATNVVKNQLGS
ncbi:hypothetical protein nbrc107696_09990 [Gordonia spumicola]|uniref:DoxX family protein n=1 Tax=Gordonia spumicola TaxID=589161 RepID=A0A7I9V638_9ACTN|nr:hypothetical protein [Gordonia spumicola]GEE00553.1 hypothetical protein nbrc107696_09990 [Gordonia spumicola]